MNLRTPAHPATDTELAWHRRGRIAGALLLLAGALAACGGGGGGGAGDSTKITGTSGATVSGVVAVGDALAAAQITLKDQTGAARTATSASDGSYSVDVSGLTAPFLVEAVSADGHTTRFGAATAAGIGNIHPLTDLALQAYFEAQGTRATNVFAGLTSASLLPAAVDLDNLASAARAALGAPLTADGVPRSFDIFRSAFKTDRTGFDLLLHDAAVSGSSLVVTTGSLTSTVTFDATAGTIDISGDNRDSASGAHSTSDTTVAATAQTRQQQADVAAAVAGIGTLWQNLLSTAASKGAGLTAADLLPYFDAAFLDRGALAADYAARLALVLTGLMQGQTVQLQSVGPVYGTAVTAAGAMTTTASVDLKVTSSTGGGSFVLPLVGYHQAGFSDDGRPGFVVVKEGDGRYKLYGDQSLAFTSLYIADDTFYASTGSTRNQVFGLSAFAPFAVFPSLAAPAGTGAVASIGVTSASGQLPSCTGSSPFALGRASATLTQALVGSAALTLNGEELFLGCSAQLGLVSSAPPAGSAFQVTYTTPSGASNSVTAKVAAQTDEIAQLTSIDGQAPATFLAAKHVADVVGTPMTFAWALPTTFAVDSINIVCNTFDAFGNQVLLPTVYLDPTALSGSSASIPATLFTSGLPTVSVFATVNFVGRNGELLSAAFVLI